MGTVNLAVVPSLIRAAGGLVLRRTAKGRLRVLVAHRPRYDDWSLPKGKTDTGETPAQTAVREVLEETGSHCRIIAPLGHTRYPVGDDEKEVTWFAMRPLPDSPGFRPNGEVDVIRWLSPPKAIALLDYHHDQALVTDSDLEGLSRTGTIRLFRHVAAGDRSDWDGPDRDRPISGKGKRQAHAVAEALRSAGVERILTSPYRRCVQSVKPMAAMIGAKIEKTSALAEGAYVDEAYRLLVELAGANAVLCSHGDVIPALLQRLAAEGLRLEAPLTSPKGSIWEIEVERGKPVVGRYLPPPG